MPQNEKKTNGESQVTAVDSETAGQKQSNVSVDEPLYPFDLDITLTLSTWVDLQGLLHLLPTSIRRPAHMD